MKNSFSKSERLSGKKCIEELFTNGESFRIYPLKITLHKHQQQNKEHVCVLISAPKHFFKNAHDRNLIKRRIREAYRINKHSLVEVCKLQQKYLSVAFQYANKKTEDYSIIEMAVIKALNRIEKL
jgi:ribonuclease P protein component